MTRRTGLKGSSVDRKGGVLLIFFFLRDRLRFRTRSVRNLCRLFRLAMSCQPPATLGIGVVHDHIAWASTRHLRSLALLSASASRTEHGNGPARPSCGRLSQVPRVGAKMISGGCSTQSQGSDFARR